MRCPKCKKELNFPYGKIPFRAVCPHCSVELHACVHCRYHNPSLANECQVKTSLFVRDRKAYNFCEDFSLKTIEKNPVSTKNQSFEDLFADENPPSSSKKGKAAFEDLFVD